MHTPAQVLICAHGTASASGQAAIAQLIQEAAQRLAPATVTTTFVDVQEPTLAQSLSELAGPVTVVPLFLSSGYHVRQDVPEAVGARQAAQPESQIQITPALGPAPEIAAAIAGSIREQLTAAGLSPSGTRLILAWAGSSDPRALDDVRTTAGWIGELLGTEIEVGSLSAGGPSVEDLLSHEPDGLPIYLQSYLLAPGFFQDKLSQLAQASNAQASAPLIGEDSIRGVLVSLLSRRAGQA